MVFAESRSPCFFSRW